MLQFQTDLLPAYDRVIGEICDLAWSRMSEQELVDIAWAYYFFSIQFRENLAIARELHPSDDKLAHLEREECDTANLSPWPGIAQPGEKLNHDEFMRRALTLSPIASDVVDHYFTKGAYYLDLVRGIDRQTRALSIASYEDGGLERVFRAILTANFSDHVVLSAFRHFLAEHIRFDSEPGEGHGALARHLQPDDRILPLWVAFKKLLLEFAPGLAQVG